jgi:cell division protein FtsN
MKKNETGKKENRLEKVVVFLLVVLISLLSFSVGVISGKGLSDKEYALKSFDQKYSHALNTEAVDEKNGESDLSEEEIQQLANAAIQAAEKNGGAEADEEVAENTHDAKTEHASVSVGGAVPADRKGAHGAGPVVTASKTPVLMAKAPAKASEEERQPSSVKKASLEAEFTVQVAAYPSIKDAETLSASLVKKGYPAFPIKVMVNGTEWYRVSVGSFKNRQEAFAYQNDLKKQGVVKDAVVQKLTK